MDIAGDSYDIDSAGLKRNMRNPGRVHMMRFR